ncbi:hypothetical protein GCM10010329_57040 [Streptomyces spiroverticillatus]|uniref:Integral membrane protein n=1 Tax=Streptomyces finlayi TaxID=67296 RepID=A0A918X3C0_9ACTN|nr:hypothetical protein [Streptomyces finlayi]GHA26427.1 hypothetical protein GCM10010329_57040 [Streptomyces spiroverticillatus]GHD07938.1 hypothetical protein GCM10010334_60710 [Streptomyces finlayi]
MRASRAYAATALACTTVALAAPAAFATNGPGNVTVNPYSVHQGSTISIAATGCGHGGTVTSNAFSQVSLSAGAKGYASARINDDTTPGHYNLAVKCSDNAMVATHRFTVLAGRGAHGGLGGSHGPSDTDVAVGASLVASAALGGAIFVARRRNAVGGRA